MINVFVMIGNSDNKLDRADWAWFIKCVNSTLKSFPVVTIWGEFYCLPNIKYQNACWHIGISSDYPFDTIKKALADLAKAFNQDSIAWIECKDTEFLG
jgi:hypothetical protein